MKLGKVTAAIIAMVIGASASNATTTLNWSIVDSSSGGAAKGHIVFATTGNDLTPVAVYLDSFTGIPGLTTDPMMLGVYTDINGDIYDLAWNFAASFIDQHAVASLTTPFDLGPDGSYISGGFIGLIDDRIVLDLNSSDRNDLQIFSSGSIVGDRTIFTVPSSVPEPAAWIMMVGGFGVLGSTLRRRPQVDVSFA